MNADKTNVTSSTPWGDLEIADAHVHYFSPAFFRFQAEQKGVEEEKEPEEQEEAPPPEPEAAPEPVTYAAPVARVSAPEPHVAQLSGGGHAHV